MEASHYALVQGWRETRSTLAAWNDRPGPVLRTWVRASLGVAVALLAAVWFIATLSEPAVNSVTPISRDAVGSWGDVAHVVVRNSLVLALHAMACVAGFIARSSLPLQLEDKRGVWRVVHERAGSIAVACVAGAITFSLSAQAYLLGTNAGTLAARLRMSPGLLLLALSPHALPELTVLFLPLAAWLIASRRHQWNQLMAATGVTVVLALPVLVMAALIEVFVSPRLVSALAP